MKISVIVPVYNGEKYIVQCIENLLCQTHKNLEIIIVNDGSHDRTAEIAANYPVRLINQSNEGAAAARNRGTEAATGDYVHFMDVDDLINLEFYECMAASVALTGADMACCEFIDEAQPHYSLMFPRRLLLVEVEDKFSITRARSMGHSVRWLIRRTFLTDNDLKFPVGWIIEDLPIVLQIVYYANKIVTVPGAVYYYKRRESSTLNERNPEFVEKRDEHWEKAKAFRKEFLSSHNLRSFKSINIVQKIEIKIAGIPVGTELVYDNGTVRRYFLGMRVMQKKLCRIAAEHPYQSNK